MAENIQEIFWLVNPHTMEVVYVSRAYEQICERPVAQLYASPLSYRETIHPDDSVRILSKLAVLAETQRMDEEFRIVCPNGTVKWLEVHGFTARDKTGQIISLVGTSQEITARKQIELALRESEDRYRDLVEHSSDLICTHDLEGRLLSINELPMKVLGYSRQEMLDRPMQDFLSPEARPAFVDYLSNIQKDGFAKGLLVVLTKSGDRRIWQYHNTLRTEGVTSPVVRGVAHDVTEAKLAEKELRRSEEKFSKAFHSSPGILSISTVREGLFIDVNEGFEKYTEYHREEIIGHTVHELGLWEHPQEREDFIREIETCGRVKNREFQFRTRRGDPSILILSVEVIELRGEKCLLAMGQDITARRRAEEALRSTEEKYRTLFLEAPYGIYRADVYGKLLIVNPALVQMLGYDTAYELMTKNLVRDVFLNPVDRSEVFNNCKDGQLLLGEEVRWKKKDGTSILVRLSGRINRGLAGQVDFNEMMVEDITQRRAMENQMGQVQKMEAIALLASGIAHDFNNIMTGILGCGELLLKSTPHGDERRDRIENIVQAALEGRELTAKLLAFNNNEVLLLHPVNLDTELIKLKDMLKRLITESVTVEFSLEAGASQVLLQNGMTSQIILNLAANARDAMPGGGKLNIRTSVVDMDDSEDADLGILKGRYVCLEVSDTGCGMSKEVRDRIFEPFFTTKKNGKGTGLGLYTVYRMLRQCSAQIRVRSEVGRGTTFEIYFLVVERSEDRNDHTPQSMSRGTRKDLIMIVEDDLRVRNMLRDQVKELGYSVLCEERAMDAINDLERLDIKIDLLLSDVVMPELSGPELARRLRKVQPNLRVLYITGYASEDLLSDDDLAGKADLLRKPFKADELNSKIHGLLDRRASECS
jgi:two-component system cell cycle sensor histidine kinase/response regulator CckA